jgi:Family of unknown function (DUF6941)
MRLLLCVVAESASIDAATNRLSIFNILEEIHSQVFPAAYPQMTIVTICARENNESNTFTLTLRITIDGQEKPLLSGPFYVDFQGRVRARSLGQIAGLLIPATGILRFELLEGEQQLGSWETLVQRIGEAVVTPQPTGPTGPVIRSN